MEPRAYLRALFDTAVAAAQPALCVPQALPAPPTGRTVVIGAGKASAAMAKAVEDHWPGALEGLVVTRYGFSVPCNRIEIVEASHPVPDRAGIEASRRMLGLVGGLGEDDLVICLISGGGSALLCLPAEGLTLADKQAVTGALLRAGTPISEINVVRKHLSAIKGGRLAAAAAPARILTLAISDVPGDDPSAIASGPTVADPSSFADARAILAKYDIAPPDAVLRHLLAAAEESPKPGDPRLARAEYRIVASPGMMLEAAAARARADGIAVEMWGDALEGEARELGREHGQRALATAAERRPRLILSGGEATVTIKGNGRGGPNAEYALALAMTLDGAPGIHAIACDTDGIDGSEDNAGATIGPDTLNHARALGLEPAAALAANDSYGFFAALDDLVISGPTRTNVNDFRAILLSGGSVD